MTDVSGWVVEGKVRASPIRQLNKIAHDYVMAFEHCAQAHLVLPAVSICFAWIDSAAAIGNADGSASKEAFAGWLSLYGSDQLSELRVSATDVYSARCGVLHTLSPSSKLVTKGLAKSIGYAVGDNSVAPFNVLADHFNIPARMLHIKEIASLAFGATDVFFAAIGSDSSLRARVQGNVEKLFFDEMSPAQANNWLGSLGVDFSGLAP
jgi:hypothetical protein